MPIHISRISARDEMFTWSPHDGPVLHFATTRLIAYLEASGAPVVPVELTQALVEHCIRKHGVEPGHLPRLTRERLQEPCVLVAWPDGSHVVADGNHRVVARHLLGFETFPAWMVEERVWRRFTIEGVPSNPREAQAFARRYPQFKRWASHL
jgi:hypothetical protein